MSMLYRLPGQLRRIKPIPPTTPPFVGEWNDIHREPAPAVSPAVARIKEAATAPESPTIPMSAMRIPAGMSTAPQRIKSAATGQAPQMAPEPAFDAAMAAGERPFSVPRIAPAPPATEAVAMPDASAGMPAPTTAPVTAPRAGVPQPAPDTHKGGFWHRLWDAFRLAGSVGQASGGSGSQMLGAFIGGLAKPEAYEAYKYRYEQMPEYHQARARDIQEQAALDQGQIRRIQMGNVIADNERADRAEARQTREHESEMRIRQQQLDLNTQKALDDELNDWMMRNPGLPVPKELADRVKKPWLAGHTVPARVRASRDPNPVFKEAADGVLYQLDRDTGEWFPTTTKGGDVFRTPRSNQERKITASDRAAAKVRAQNRVKQEYTGGHINQLINDYAKGLYQTYAQESGVTWELEQLANNPPPETTDRNYWQKVGEREHATRLIQTARSRAQAEAKRIIERDLERLEAQYLDEELELMESEKPGRGSSVSRIRRSAKSSTAPVPKRSPEEERAEAEKALNERIAAVQSDSRLDSNQKRAKIQRLQDLFNKYFGQ